MRDRKIADNLPIMGRVFSYLRWSSDRQTWGDSERRQNDMAEASCARNGVKLAGQEKDEGVSAFKGANRRAGSGLDRLLHIMRAGDVLLVEDNDRWSREKPLDSLNALRSTVNKGVKIVFLRTGVEMTRENFDNPEILFPSFFGSYLANAGEIHGFLLSGGVFTSFDPPGSGGTVAFGINDLGAIVGAYLDSSGAHGFLRTP